MFCWSDMTMIPALCIDCTSYLSCLLTCTRYHLSVWFTSMFSLTWTRYFPFLYDLSMITAFSVRQEYIWYLLYVLIVQTTSLVSLTWDNTVLSIWFQATCDFSLTWTSYLHFLSHLNMIPALSVDCYKLPILSVLSTHDTVLYVSCKSYPPFPFELNKPLVFFLTDFSILALSFDMNMICALTVDLYKLSVFSIWPALDSFCLADLQATCPFLSDVNKPPVFSVWLQHITYLICLIRTCYMPCLLTCTSNLSCVSGLRTIQSCLLIYKLPAFISDLNKLSIFCVINIIHALSVDL